MEEVLNVERGIGEWKLVGDTKKSECEKCKQFKCSIESCGRLSAGLRCLLRMQYREMLNDGDRNVKFKKGLHIGIEQIKKNNPHQPISVIDIGAGSGLLSVMAAQMDATKVTAFEQIPDLCHVAHCVAVRNGVGNRIEFISNRSTDCDSMDRAQILVTETLDSAGLGEGILPSIRHAKQNLLCSDPSIIPARLRLKCQLIESPILFAISTRNECSCGHSVSFEMHVDQLRNETGFRVLSKVFNVFEIDFENASLVEFDENRAQVDIVSNGRVDAAVVWFEIDLDRSGNVVLSTAPEWINDSNSVWRAHWKQNVHLFSDSSIVEAGTTLCVNAKRDDHSLDLSFSIQHKRNIKLCLRHTAFEVFGHLRMIEMFATNISSSNQLLLAEIDSVLKRNHSKALIIDVSDGSLLPSLIEKHAKQRKLTCRVLSIESAGIQSVSWTKEMLKSTPKTELHFEYDQIYSSTSEHWSMYEKNLLLNGSSNKICTHADAELQEIFITGDAYFSWLQNAEVWLSILRLWYSFNQISKKLPLDWIPKFIPERVTLHACVIHCPKLYDSRRFPRNPADINHSFLIQSNKKLDGEWIPSTDLFAYEIDTTSLQKYTRALHSFDLTTTPFSFQSQTKLPFNPKIDAHALVVFYNQSLESIENLVSLRASVFLFDKALETRSKQESKEDEWISVRVEFKAVDLEKENEEHTGDSCVVPQMLIEIERID